MNKNLINLPELHIQAFTTTDSQISITAQSKASTAPCPQCGVVSRRIHSYYRRSGKDLPAGGQPASLQLEASRFRCMNEQCPRRTLVERLSCLPLRAHRTARLSSALQAIAFGMGGEAGCRLASQLQMPVSADTLLRLIRNWYVPKPPVARVVGVDEMDLMLRIIGPRGDAKAGYLRYYHSRPGNPPAN